MQVYESKQWNLKNYPVAKIGLEHFELITTSISGGTVIQNKFLTLDPFAKAIMAPGHIEKDGPIISDAVGEVIQSDREDLVVGDIVVHKGGWREYHALGKDEWYLKVPDTSIDLTYYLSILGSTARTAFVGIKNVLNVQPGWNVGVSGVTGATGLAFAQMAKLEGCNVLGFTSSLEKANWVKDNIGIEVIVQKDCPCAQLSEETFKVFPDGMDAYQEHVDNTHLFNAMTSLKPKSTLALCGLMRTYNGPMAPVPNLNMSIWKNINIQGFMLANFPKEVTVDNFFTYMSEKLPQFKWKQSTINGIENMDSAFLDMFQNFDKGKIIINLQK